MSSDDARPSIEPMGPADHAALLDMFLLSMNWRPDQNWTAEAVLADDHTRRYIEQWGARGGDVGVLARGGAGQVLGAAWARCLPPERPGYGFVAADIPELGLAVAPDARGRGLGRMLMDALVGRVTSAGARALSLSVEDGNDAARALYASLGFTVVGRTGDADTMLLDLTTRPNHST